MSDHQNKMSSVILNVDDNEAMRHIRKRVLSSAGYHIIDAESGEEALLLVATKKPDLILLDVGLPGMDGIEVCCHIKSDKELSHISILQVSNAPTSQMNLSAGGEGGADGYLVEPIHPIELLATVRTLLRLAHREQEYRRMIGQMSRLERQFIEATNAADCGLWDWDIVSGKLEWFGAHERLAGMLPGGFNGKIEAFSEILHPNDRTRVWNKVQGCMAAREEHFTDEYRFVHPDGSVHWMAARGRFYYDAAERAVRMTGVVQDISTRKAAEEALQRSEHRYRTLVEATSAVTWSCPPSGLHIEAQPSWMAFTGQTEEEMLGAGWTKAVHPDDVAAAAQRWNAAVTNGTSFLSEHRIRRYDGEWRWMSVYAEPIRDAEGRLLEWTSLTIDNTDRKHAEESLRKSEERWRLALEGADLGSWDVDLITGLVTWNDQHALIQGYPPDVSSASLEQWQRLVHPDDLDRVMTNIEQAKREHSLFDEEHRFYRADTGELRWMSLYGRFSYEGSGRPVRFSGVSLDITDRKRVEEELHRFKDELEMRVRERTGELLATQTRLMTVTSQLILTEQQERRKLARDLHDYLAQLLVVGEMKTKLLAKQVASLPTGAALVQDLDRAFHQALTYTRTLIAELSPPSLHNAGLPSTLQWLGERFEKDGLRVHVRVDCASVPLSEDRAVVVFQGVRELLFNVMKHAGVNEATVTLMLDEDDRLRVSVADRGKGATPEALQGSIKPGHLGLVSVRERFHAMGGHVEVISAPGEGTTVTLVLPLHEVQSERREVDSEEGENSASPLNLPTASAIRVLLVDDHSLVRQGLRDILEADDRVRVVGEAGSCEEALTLAGNIVPDVVIMDINLPDTNGIDATKRFKMLYPQITVIGLSAHSNEQINHDMVSAGAETLLAKECAVDELIPAIVKLAMH